MKQKWLVLVALLMALILAFAGCATSGVTATTTASKPPVNATASATTPSNTNTASNKIVIGVAHRNLLGATGADMRAAEYWEAEQEGVEIKFFDSNGKVDAQANFIEDCLAGGQVKAIIVWAADANGISKTIQACNAKGIPVVSVDISIPDAKVVNHVASDNVQIGRTAGEQAVKYLTEKNGSAKGKIIICTATTSDSLRNRTEGFLEIIKKYPEIKYDTFEMVKTTIDDGVKLADDLMQKYPKGSIDLIFGANVSPGLGAVTAAQTAGRTDFGVISVDYDKNLVAELQKGKGKSVLIGFIAQDPFNMGETAMKQAIKAAKGQSTGDIRIATNTTFVTVDTVQKYVDDYNAYSTKVTKFR